MTEASGGGGDGGNKGAGGGGKRGGRSRRRRRGGKRGKGGDKAAAGQPSEQQGGQPKGGQQPAAKQGSGKSGRKRRRGGGGGGGNAPQKKQIQLKPFNHVVKKYGVMVFDTFEAAYRDLEKIKDQTGEVDQLNVVIRAEGDMDDPKLMEVDKVKVFAGTAWALIHERRIEDGWYEEPR